jgi:hypothetical protein
MKTWAKITLSTVGLLVGGTLLGLLAVWAAFTPRCGNDILAELPSPDNQRRAVIFQRNCGATTGFNTEVSILRGSSRLGNEAGNAFAADADHGQAPTGPSGGPVVTVRWIDPLHLVVNHDARVRVLAADSLVEGVRIRFVSTGPPGA